MFRMHCCLLGLVVISGACAPKAAGTGSTGSGTGSTGSGTGTATVSSTSASTGTTGGDDCAAWNDEPVPGDPPIAIRLRNETQSAIYLPLVTIAGSPQEPYEIRGVEPDTSTYWPRDYCLFTCQEMLEGICGICDTGGPYLDEGKLLRLEPFGVYVASWNRQVLTVESIPDRCLQQDPYCYPAPCERAQSARPGTYRATGLFLLQPLACQNDPAACSCTPNADGWCETQAAYAFEEPTRVDVEFEYPAADAVDIVFSGGP